MKQANELRQGDIIRTELYSYLWKRTIATPVIVLDVHEFCENTSIMVKAKDGLKEYIKNIFVPSTNRFELLKEYPAGSFVPSTSRS